MIGIPEGGTPAHVKITPVYLEAMHVPKRIIPLKAAIPGHNVAALLNSGLALTDDNILQDQVMGSEQRALPSKLLTFYQFHIA